MSLRQASLRGWASLRASMQQQQAVGASLQQQQQRAMSSAAAGETIEVEVAPFKAHKIDPPKNVVTTTADELKGFYTLMYTMRRMEIAADMMYKAKLIRGFCHLYDGQEAVMTGLEAALTRDDSLITSYRDHCQHLARGGTVLEVMAELMGKRTGASKGLGGSMHMYRREANFFGGCGIVGAQIPLGAGLALAHKYSGRRNVAVTMYGDGAANQGQKYEALNMAGLWALPTIFVCENNHYGMGTAEWRGSKSPTFYTRGDYIPGLKVDGMDVLAVKQAAAFAREHVLDNGPIILEMDTYRYHGHSMSDPGSTYRTRDEISAMRQERDPVERVKKLLVGPAGVDPAEVKRIEREAKKVVDQAVEQAKSDPIPPDAWAWRNAYAGDGNTKGNPMTGGVEVDSLELRDITGGRVKPVYDPTYAS